MGCFNLHSMYICYYIENLGGKGLSSVALLTVQVYRLFLMSNEINALIFPFNQTGTTVNKIVTLTISFKKC